MRKIHFVLAALSAAVLCLMTACGASKKVSIENPDGVALANDPCVDLCMQSPYTRAYGKGTHFKEMTARNIAELQANAMYARKIEKAVPMPFRCAQKQQRRLPVGRDDVPRRGTRSPAYGTSL